MNIKFIKNIGLFLILSVFLSINLTNNSLSKVVAMKIDPNANIRTENGIYNKMMNKGNVIYAQQVGSKILYTGAVKIMKDAQPYPIISVYDTFNYSPLPKGVKKMWRLKASSLDIFSKPTQIRISFLNKHPDKFSVKKSNSCECNVVFEIPRIQGGTGNWTHSSYTDLIDVPSKINGPEKSHMRIIAQLVAIDNRNKDLYGALHYLELQEFNVLE